MKRLMPRSLWLIPWAILVAVAQAQTPTPSTPALPSDKPEIHFLSGDEARSAYLDESIEPYFSLLQTAEMTAKTSSPIIGDTLAAQREETKKRYSNAVEDFTSDEQAALTWYIGRFYPAVADYPLYAHTPWSFIKIDESLEGGFPHTRGRSIVLSGKVVGELMQMKNRAPESIAVAQAAMLLLHEQSHVMQRLHKSLFADLYTKVWGFEHVDAIEPDPWLTEHQLRNPDGIDLQWVYPLHDGDQTRYILPLVVLPDLSPDHLTMQEISPTAVELEKTATGFRVKTGPDKQPVMESLMTVKPYVDRFVPSDNIYHPNETEADLFATLIVYDTLQPPQSLGDDQKQTLEKTFGPLRQWLKENLVEAKANASASPAAP